MRSSGGVVAFEAANLLEKIGSEVKRQIDFSRFGFGDRPVLLLSEVENLPHVAQ